MKTYTVQLEEDGEGNLMLPIPQAILDETGWQEGDTLRFVDNKNGSWQLFKTWPAEPSIDDMLLGLLGSDEFVKTWWNSPNAYFKFHRPIDCDREVVYNYVCSYALR